MATYSEDIPKRPAGAQADVSIRTSTDKDASVRTTIRTNDDKGPFRWPTNGEEWKGFLRALIPYVAGAAVLVAATSSYQTNKCEREKDNMTYADLTARKAGKTGETWEDTKTEARRGWFGLKRNASKAADEAENKWEDTKAAAKKKAEDAKAKTKSTGSWVGEKAHDAVDSAKSAAYKAEHAVGAAGSSVLAGASAVEEKTGRVIKDAGKTLEADGADQRRYWRGEEVKQDVKKKGYCSIM